jgi:hypothetical protein
MATSKIAAQEFRDNRTGQILDLELVKPSKKLPPVFPEFVQIPPTGAALLAYSELRPQAISFIFAALTHLEWNNLFTLSPARLQIIARVPTNQYSVILNQLLKAGVILRVYSDRKEFRFWLNPQIAWRGDKRCFWTVCEKFRCELWGSRKLIPGGTQELLQAERVGRVSGPRSQKTGTSLLPQLAKHCVCWSDNPEHACSYCRDCSKQKKGDTSG